MTITINGDGDINATGNDIELNPTGTTDVTLAVGGGNVGIGTASPSAPLQIQGSSGEVRLQRPTSTQADWSLKLPSSGGELTFYDNNNTAERARIDSSGNLLVGKTSSGGASTGAELRQLGDSWFTRGSGAALNVNRTSSDGDIVVFYKDTTEVGSIGSLSGDFFIASSVSNGSGLLLDANTLRPMRNGALADNIIDLGGASQRFDDVYATNGTIQTSDLNLKTDIAELDEAEKRVATAAKGLIRKFRWIDSVEAKGDDARIHIGVIAQDLKAAFEAEGLDAGRYAMFISTTWWEADEVIPAVEEVLDEEGNVITEAQPERTETRTYETAEEAPEGAVERTRLGVRYNQLLAFIIGAM